MRIQTNYAKQDWKRLFSTVIIAASFYIIAVSLFLDLVFEPTWKALAIIVDFFGERETAEAFIVFWFDSKNIEFTNPDQILTESTGVFMLIGIIIIGFAYSVYWIAKTSLKLGFRFCKWCDIAPVMDLVLIKNGYYWKTLKTSKFKSK